MEQSGPEKENNTPKPEVNEVEELKKALNEAKIQAESNLIGWQRAQADFTNFKRYTEQEKAENLKFANVGLLSAILPILDDFERALAMIPVEHKNQKWIDGMEMIRRKFKDVLAKQGVTQIQALGMEFDCRLMEAVTTCPGKKDIVIQELEKGYKLQDRVIRPSRVVVGCGEEPNKEG